MTLFAFNTDDVSDAVGYRATDITGWRLLGYTVTVSYTHLTLPTKA